MQGDWAYSSERGLPALVVSFFAAAYLPLPRPLKNETPPV
jgi:hypothetical protein